jgi:hypothetical protein
MKDRIDRALRTMFLRRKLRAIEARRIKYPATTEGRKQYVEDSLKPKYQVIFYILIVIGIAGLILCLTLCFKGHDFRGLWLIGLLSMVIFALGVQGLERREP